MQSKAEQDKKQSFLHITNYFVVKLAEKSVSFSIFKLNIEV